MWHDNYSGVDFYGEQPITPEDLEFDELSPEDCGYDPDEEYDRIKDERPEDE